VPELTPPPGVTLATHAPRRAEDGGLAGAFRPPREWLVGGTLGRPLCPTCGAPCDSRPVPVLDPERGWVVRMVPAESWSWPVRDLPCGHEWPRDRRWSVSWTVPEHQAEPTTPGSRVWARWIGDPAPSPRRLFVLAPMAGDSPRSWLWVAVDRVDCDRHVEWLELADVLVEHRAPEVVPVEGGEAVGDAAQW
jgi:hypothetical protein